MLWYVIWSRIKRLEAAIADIAKLVENLAGKLEKPNVAQASVESLLAKTFSSQSDQIESVGKLLQVAYETAASTIAKRNGKKGGLRTQQNKRNRRVGCAICAGDRAATASDILRHLAGHGTSTLTVSENGDNERNRTREDPKSDIPTSGQ